MDEKLSVNEIEEMVDKLNEFVEHYKNFTEFCIKKRYIITTRFAQANKDYVMAIAEFGNTLQNIIKSATDNKRE